jgi:hypothetical protein
VQRGLRQRLLEAYPGFEPYIEEIMPKKGSLEAVKLYVTSESSHHPSQARPFPPLPCPFRFVSFHCTRINYRATATNQQPQQPRQSNPLHNRLNPALLPTNRRPANPTPKTRPPIPLRPANDPNRPRRNPLRAFRRRAHGSRSDFAGWPSA